MEVLHRGKNSTSPLTSYVPQQDGPVDLTTGSQIHSSSLFHHYPLDPTLQKMAFPHLRFNGRLNADFYEKSFSKTPKIDTTLEQKTNDCYPILPKKRKILDSEHCGMDQPIKRSKLDYEVENFHSGSLSYNHGPIPPSHPSLPQRMDAGKNCHPPPPADLDTSMLMERIMNPHYIDASPESIKETENLLAAVQHSQMLYYSYCTQLLQNLQTRRILQEQEHYKKCLESSVAQIERQKKEVKLAPPVGKTQPSSAPCYSSPKDESLPVSTTETLTYSSPKSVPPPPSQSPKKDTPPSPTWSSPEDVSRMCSASGFIHASTPLNRKRAPRALTGKHVRPGTGASPTTLLTLRQKVAERLKTKEDDEIENASKNRKTSSKGKKYL